MSALCSDTVAEQMSAVINRPERHARWVARAEGLGLDAAAARADRKADASKAADS